MTTHQIEALLSGPVDRDVERRIATQLPMTLVPVTRWDARAPDYRLEADGQPNLGAAWSQMSPGAQIPYVSLVIVDPAGAHISGVAWQSPTHDGRWFAQLQHVSEVGLHA